LGKVTGGNAGAMGADEDTADAGGGDFAQLLQRFQQQFQQATHRLLMLTHLQSSKQQQLQHIQF
jgi:hypothetical protein